MKAKAMGFSGENLAAHYLHSKGYEILRNNFVVKGGEIDLIAKYGNTLVFVEVKTRTSESFGSGDESVDSRKKRRLKRAIEKYLDKHATNQDQDYRVDIIEIELHPITQKLLRVNHFEDIEI